MRIRTKKHRLPEAAYFGDVTVAITACEAKRRRPFIQGHIVEQFVQELAEAGSKFGCKVPIYCFMPDHVHVILTGQTMQSRPKLAIEHFKHQTGNWFKEFAPQFEWQDDFYDHIIRKSEDWRAQVQYIAGNPVRAGLVEDMFAYPYSGSIGYDFAELLVNS